DANHNPLTKTYSDGTPGITNAYDAFNRLVGVTDGVGTIVYSYDGNSQLTTIDGPWPNDTISNWFDPLGHLTNQLVQGSQPIAYTYDALNRVTGVQVGAGSYTYSYSGANPLMQRLDRPNGSYATYTYDGLDRLTDTANKQSSGQIISELSYTYNTQDLRDT